ncbi:hypothetical protein [Mesorhizobium sp.]|uniref:hypothetical protein n=1 Tax=Mesorhizobium sp. TaxID=1871066 RepID=UPI00257AC955|nr:hypothetical protein [Mesorhizobium sp.]
MGSAQRTHAEKYEQRSHLQRDAEQDRHNGKQVAQSPWHGVGSPMRDEAERKASKFPETVIEPSRKIVSISSSFGSFSSKRPPLVQP